MTLHDRVVAALREAGMKTTQELTPTLQDKAVESGWSTEAAESLKLEHDGSGAFHTSFDDAGADFEYGIHGRPPIPAGRKTHLHLNEEVAPTLDRHLKTAFRGWL